jgi:hypothetical protein
MTKTIIFFVIAFCFSSCYYRMALLTPEQKMTITKQATIYENDTVKIGYNFWAKNGLMSFDIYNKMDVPIYFDWKKSAFIPNDKMMSYWQDETNTVGISNTTAAYMYGGTISGKTKSSSKSVRQERIGVIPSHAMITSSKYTLTPFKTKEPVNATYSKSTTPLRFRNFLTLSTSEQFDKGVTFIDNAFFLSSYQKINQSKVAASQIFRST